MGVFLYSVETSWPEMCLMALRLSGLQHTVGLMALRLSGLRCVVGLIRHLCRHPAQARGIT
ncbi:hypothetical protein DOB32_21670 [Salmonella enterica subsp. enterica serovar Enteritidis]|nr:hypothetical protein [Salmonella enterica subsp. enterica serovar Enteritidis]EBV3031895.1 hypothetical protein [Salmonella enterica subsp. enterica serovar Enteritidis]